MNRTELLEKIIAGRFILVGEFRGGRAEARGYVDTKTGKASKSVVITYVIECTVTGHFDQVLVRRRAPSTVADPATVAKTAYPGTRT